MNFVEGAHRDLGAAIGDLPETQRFVREKVQKWTERVETMAKLGGGSSAPRSVRGLSWCIVPYVDVHSAHNERRVNLVRPAP